MNSPKVTLALRIIGDQFGDIVQDVARVLTEGDKCTIPHIFRTVNANISARALLANTSGPSNKKGMNIDGATVRTALMVLYQHNCLFVDPPKAPENVSDNPQTKAVPQTGFLYSLNVASVLHRLHFARMLSIIRAKYGDTAVYVAEAVMLHGKMRLDQIQHQVVFERNASSSDGATITPQEVKAAFETLVSNRFIITVPLADKSRTSEPTVTFNVAEGGGRSGVKRTFDFLNAVNPSADAGGKRSKTVAKPAAVPSATSNRRIVAPKLAPADDGDDGIPVELRMMMGGLDGAGAGAVKKSAAEQAQAAQRANTADAEWSEEAFSTSAAGRGGRGAGRGGRGGAAMAGGRLVGRGGRGAGSSSSNSSGASQEMNVKPEGTTSAVEGGGAEGVLQAASAAPLWMIGWDQFIRETRHAACVQVVTLLHESVAGSVIRIMLALSMSTEMGPKQTKSGEVSVAEIFAQLEREYHAAHAKAAPAPGKGTAAARGRMGAAGGSAGSATGSAGGAAAPAGALPVRLDLMSLKRLLEYLRLSESGAVIKVVGSEQESGGPSYMVSMDGLVTLLQRRTIFSVASERFGFVSARIVELLQRHQYLEQQQVCDMALLPARETRERLYKLFLDGWVNYVDLSKRADFNPSTSFYFWFLDLPLLKSTIRDHTYQTMHNILVRRAYEAEGGRELLDREDCIDNEADRVKHAQLMHRLNKLDLALLQVHSSVLLMEHF